MAIYVGIGATSGTSLNGLNVCCVELIGDEDTDNWKFNILRAQSFPYNASWRGRLQKAHKLNGRDLLRLHAEFGHFVGETVRTFMDQNPDIDDIKFVAFHGHTVFHQPDESFTFQLGDGETISSHLEVPLVTDFRTKDVALGGHGSPLMVVGERRLFSECNIFLHLGGICSITVEEKSFDVVACNMMLNYLSEQLHSDKPCDEDGKVADTGKVIPDLLTKLNSLSYYQQAPPKTIGREWFEQVVAPLLDMKAYSIADLLRTGTEHITDQIMTALSLHARDDSDEPVRLENAMLITGDGALNSFLMKMLMDKLSQLAAPITVCEVDRDTTLFRKAILLAFTGLRTLLGNTSTLCLATGARVNAVAGSIHLPPGGEVLPPHLNKVCPFHIMRKKSRASTTSFGSTEQLEIPATLAQLYPQDECPRMMEEPRRMKRTLTQ